MPYVLETDYVAGVNINKESWLSPNLSQTLYLIFPARAHGIRRFNIPNQIYLFPAMWPAIQMISFQVLVTLDFFVKVFSLILAALKVSGFVGEM